MKRDVRCYAGSIVKSIIHSCEIGVWKLEYIIVYTRNFTKAVFVPIDSSLMLDPRI